MQKLIVKPVNKDLCKISVEDRPSAKGETYWPTEHGAEVLTRVYHHFKAVHVVSTLYGVPPQEAIDFIQNDPELGSYFSDVCPPTKSASGVSQAEEIGVYGLYTLGIGLVVIAALADALVWGLIVVAATLFMGNKR